MELQEYLNKKEYAINNYEAYLSYGTNCDFLPLEIKKLHIVLNNLRDKFLKSYFKNYTGLERTTRDFEIIIFDKNIEISQEILNKIDNFINDNKSFILINEIINKNPLRTLFGDDNYDKEKDVFTFKVVNLDYHNDDTIKEFNDFFKLLDNSNTREYFELVTFKNSIRLKLHKETINLLDKFVIDSDFLQNVKSTDYTERLKVKIFNLLNI